jgi:ABC-type branched-subunit amino acid transport system ATPase component
MLSLRNISVHYGKAEAVRDVTMEVTRGTVTGLVGNNGAGKSTILKVISGLLPLSAGKSVEDKRIDGLRPTKSSGSVSSRFRKVGGFSTATVLDNGQLASPEKDKAA